MIIRIKNKDGKDVAECELWQHDIGIWYVQDKTNIKDVTCDIEEEEFECYDILNIILDS